MRYITRKSEKVGHWEVYDTTWKSIVLSVATKGEADDNAQDLNDSWEKTKIARYTTWPGAASGRWYIFDTVKSEIVWSMKGENKADALVQYLNQISERNLAQVPVPADVAYRMRMAAAAAEMRGLEASDRAANSSNPVVKADSGRESERQYQLSHDINTLLRAAGVPEEG